MLFVAGDNRPAASMAGIKTGRIVVPPSPVGNVRGPCGVVSVLGGRERPGLMAENYTMLTVAAVVLGGTQISGGRGSYLGTAPAPS